MASLTKKEKISIIVRKTKKSNILAEVSSLASTSTVTQTRNNI